MDTAFKKLSLLLYVFVALLAVPTQAETSMWYVEKAGKHVYIGGTIHILSAKDYPLPSAFEIAYKASDKVAFETDISAMASPSVQGQVLLMMMYNDGRTLQSVLSENTYQRLAEYLSSKQIPIAALNLMNAGGVSLTMTLMELQSMGLTEAGVDRFYFDKAGQDQKQRVFLEPIETQLKFISELGEGIEDELIAYTLDDLKRLPELINNMTSSWRSGDMAAIDSLMLEPMKKEFPSAYQAMIVDRNQDWLPSIEAMLKTEEVELVLVGVAHLIGEDGVIQQLESRGYKVKQI